MLKLATYRSGGSTAIGLVDTEAARIFDIAAAARRDGASDAFFASMLALIDADDAGLDLARTWSPSMPARGTCGRRSPTSNCSHPCPSRGRCATRCRSSAYPPVLARHARAGGAREGRRGGVPRRAGGAARRNGVDLPANADLLHHQSLHRRRTRDDGAVAALQPGDGLRTGDRNRHPPDARRTFPRARRARIFSVTRFSTISPRAIGSGSKCRAASGPPRARVSMAATRWARGSSRRTNSAIRRR